MFASCVGYLDRAYYGLSMASQRIYGAGYGLAKDIWCLPVYFPRSFSFVGHGAHGLGGAEQLIKVAGSGAIPRRLVQDEVVVFTREVAYYHRVTTLLCVKWGADPSTNSRCSTYSLGLPVRTTPF